MTCCNNEFAVCLFPADHNSIRLRLAAYSGGGDATGEPGGGNWLLAGNIESLEFWLYDLDAAEPDAHVYYEDVTIADIMLAEPTDWEVDAYGFNARHVLPPAAVPTAGHRYRGKYKLELDDGEIRRVFIRGTAADNPGDEVTE